VCFANLQAGLGSLADVGPAGITLLLAALASGSGQARTGVYIAVGAPPARWTINEHHALLWDGAPYLPVGVRIPGNPEEIARAKAAGIDDALVELPASGVGWKSAFEALESAGMRYVLAVSSLAPAAVGVAVEPQAYRFSRITKRRTVECTIPGATSVFAMLVTRHDGELRKTYRVPTPGGKFSLEVVPPNDLEHVLLLYPHTSSLAQIDCWEGLDELRDRLLKSLRDSRPGPGLRGILDPAGTALRLRTQRTFVPTSKLFRAEFKDYLQTRYRASETVQRAWSLSVSDLESMDELARLVPLWSGTRGVSHLLDPDTDKTYVCDSRRSSIWEDIEAVLNGSAARRFGRLAAALRKMCDVPVVQEWTDWAAPYESGTAALDGLATRAFAAGSSAVADSAAKAASSLFRWNRPGWFVASQIELPLGSDQIASAIEDLASMGCRAWFVRTRSPAVLQALASEAAKRRVDGSLAAWSPAPLFYPEGASNPAAAMRLPGGRWWLPAPLSGNRIDLGSRFFAYRLATSVNPAIVLWTKGLPVREKLRMAEPKSAVFTTLDGSDPRARIVKGGVEVDLSELPLIVSGVDEIPVPESAYKETVWRFDELLKVTEAAGMDTTEFRFLFKEAIDGMDRNPGGSFAQLRDQYWKLSGRLAKYTWIEAEAVQETNFSEVLSIPGVSDGKALSLRSFTVSSPESYTAEYVFYPRTEAELEVWLAARIEPEHRPALRIRVAGQELRILGEPISPYGQGFAWYRMGTTRFKRGETKLVLTATAGEGIELSVDAILLYPGSFSPNGATLPDAMIFPPMPPDKR